MKNKKDFFSHPISGLAILIVISVILAIKIAPWTISMKEVDPLDYQIINVHEAIGEEEDTYQLLTVMNQTNVQSTVLVGSPDEIFNYTGRATFSNEDTNNSLVLEMAESERFYAFCTIDPYEAHKEEAVAKCIENGGSGIKLYNGHSYFYEYPLDDNQLLEVYKYAEENDVPVMLHVNIGDYLDQFENVLTLYPDMTVICPHFCLSSKSPNQLDKLLNKYPNLYVDISFGHKDYLVEGLTRISENIEVFQELFYRHADKFLFGTFTVFDGDSEKTTQWLVDTYQTYRDLLEMESYETFHIKGETLNGLGLDSDMLKKIYETNWADLLS